MANASIYRTPSPHVTRARLRALQTLVLAAIVPAVFVGTTWLAGLVIQHMHGDAAVPVSLLALAGIVVVLGLVALLWHQYVHWLVPRRRLLQALHDVSAGEAPMDEILAAGGGFRPLATPLRELLGQLRSMHAEVAELQREMGQRVAQRTDALERRLGSLRLQADRDALTGLYNRRMFDQHVQELFLRSRQNRADFCLLMMDLDNFKLLNDTLGHAAGDEALRSIGQIIRSTIRNEDMAFRFGGDEFVLVLPAGGPEAGRHIAQRLCSLVDGLARTLRLEYPVALSVGHAATSELADPTLANLVRKADERLYEVKAERAEQRPKRSC